MNSIFVAVVRINIDEISVLIDLIFCIKGKKKRRKYNFSILRFRYATTKNRLEHVSKQITISQNKFIFKKKLKKL